MASKAREATIVDVDDVDTSDRLPKEKRRVSSSTKDKSERRDRDRDHDRDREGKESRHNQPTTSVLSSINSQRVPKSSTTSSGKVSKSRSAESELIMPSGSSMSRSYRRSKDGEPSSPGKHHRSSSSVHRSSSSLTSRTKRSKDPERERTRDRDPDRDRDRDKYRDKDRDKDEDSSRRREKRSSATAAELHSTVSDIDERTKPRSVSLSMTSPAVDVVPEMARSRERLPYPSMNKAFSRESVISREDLSAPSRLSAGSASRRSAGTGNGGNGDPLTPDATDLSASAVPGVKRSKSTSAAGGSRPSSRLARSDERSPANGSVPSSRRNSRSRNSSRHHDRPPSPPDTNISSPKDHGASKWQDEDDRRDDADGQSSLDQETSPSSLRSQASRTRVKKSRTPSTLGDNVTTAQDLSKSPPPFDNTTSMASSQATYTAQEPKRSTPSPAPIRAAQRFQSRRDSDADFSSESAQESSSPKTPNPEASPNFFAGNDWKKQAPPPPPPPPPHPHPHLQGTFLAPGAGTAAAAAFAAARLSYAASPAPTPVSVNESDVSGATSQTDEDMTASMSSAVPPPPPPPPPLSIMEVPRIDYLLQNGGLPYAIPKYFLAALPRVAGRPMLTEPLKGAETLFSPFFSLLNQYQSVLSNHGSIAVATGHRTVARRLLDRLENVFSRELPSNGCSCVVCESGNEFHRGLGWGEVLERVSGRIDLPSWPPLNIAALEQRLDAAAVAAAAVGGGTGIAADLPVRPASPVKIDPDIAEEFREHYLRQNKKVRASVDRWMRECADAPASAPQEIDDETLAFAILTNLDQDDRPLFNALLSGSRDLVPAVRAPTPMRKPRQDFIIKTGLAIQRLYRLSTAPRDAETTLFLVKNPGVHDLLTTIADIHPSEWEILISGRFDGFLWSGADENGDDVATPIAREASGFFPATPGPPASRGATPASGVGMSNSPMSRNVTPASFMSGFSSATSPAGRQAVSTDEEAEVAALAEIEREIYQGMEALEDAFEVLHKRAEAVRTALRQRSAGLSMRLQQRRGTGAVGPAVIDVLPNSGGGGPSGVEFERPGWASIPGTPAPGGIHMSMHPHEFSMDPNTGAGSEADWDAGEDFFELKPEDSASNISSSQHRRPKRRHERRTPAPIEEEEEE